MLFEGPLRLCLVGQWTDESRVMKVGQTSLLNRLGSSPLLNTVMDGTM